MYINSEIGHRRKPYGLITGPIFEDLLSKRLCYELLVYDFELTVVKI